MSWFFLLIAAVFEISWAIGLKYSQGLTKLPSSAFTVITMLASFFFLALAVKQLPIGTAYAVWTGIGSFGTVILGMVLFGEPVTFSRIFFLALIITGIVGLRVTH